MRLAIALFVFGMAVLQFDRVMAQDREQPLLCPSAAPGTPEPDWMKGVTSAVRPVPGLTNPKLIKSGRPDYTTAAREAGITGEVWLNARVDVDGRVRNACVTKSLPGLDAQALKAAKEFEFTPAQQNGVAVPVIVHIQMQFNMRK